jgi:hypothetical protein
MKQLDTLPETSSPSAACEDAIQSAAPRSAPSGPKPGGRAVPRFILGLVLCLTILAVFVPLDPLMPVAGLDTSWMMAMNQAVARHLVFGTDIVFTFGPYASIYTGLYHPATDRLMILGSLFLGLSYFALLVLLGKNQKIYPVFAFGLLLAGFLNSRDALLFSYPLLLALVVHGMTLPENHGMKLRLARSLENGAAALFAPLGLLPLVKGSLLPICGATAALCCGMLWRSEKKFLASMAILATSASCVLFWVAADQPILALPKFFLSTRQIISGYTEAMAFPGDPWESVFYVLVSALVLATLTWTPGAPRISRWFLGASYALFLFLAFKGGFVRHDPWHNVTAGSAVLIAAALLLVVPGVRRSYIPILFAALVWAYIGQTPVKKLATYVPQNIWRTYDRSFRGVSNRLRTGNLRREYEQHLAAIRSSFPIDRMTGTTDIYSFDQSWLLASENSWSPRPVVQSYSAYTPDLTRLNLLHLESPGAPDNIVFRVEPIDGRLPSLEDGLSWPALIDRYSLMKLDGQSAYLRKRATNETRALLSESDVSTGAHQLGEEVPLPDTSGPLFASMEITPTFLGRIRAALYKPPQLNISLRLRDGQVVQYRAISEMMKTDFLLSPLVKSTEDFALFASGGTKYLGANQVKSITVTSEDREGKFWNASYSLRLRKKDLAWNEQAGNSALFDPIGDEAPTNLSPPSVLACKGSLEGINGSLPSAGITRIGGALSIHGWMSVDAENGIVPDSVFVTLTSEGGKTSFIRARRTQRDEIKQHFHHPEMADPGYAALIDVSALQGPYTLGLARAYQGTLGICGQFKLPVFINP